MTLRDLEIFITVAETGKMGAAANKLYISQPTVSHSISQIEEHYHVKLFERISKKLYITDTGREMLKYAEHIVAKFNQMESFLNHASENLNINIGASITVGTFFLSDIVSNFEKNNGDIPIRVYVDNSDNIIKKITEGLLDVAVIEGSVKNKDLLSEDIYEDEMVLICGKNHKFAQKQSVKLSSLRNEELVLREPGSGTREFLTDLLESKGIEYIEKWVCHSSDSIINIVAADQGISVISKALLINYNNIRQIAIDDLSLKRSFKLIYHKDKYITNSLKKLIREIRNNFLLKDQ